jgi:hypothetical protein
VLNDPDYRCNHLLAADLPGGEGIGSQMSLAMSWQASAVSLSWATASKLMGLTFQVRVFSLSPCALQSFCAALAPPAIHRHDSRLHWVYAHEPAALHQMTARNTDAFAVMRACLFGQTIHGAPLSTMRVRSYGR